MKPIQGSCRAVSSLSNDLSFPVISNMAPENKGQLDSPMAAKRRHWWPLGYSLGPCWGVLHPSVWWLCIWYWHLVSGPLLLVRKTSRLSPLLRLLVSATASFHKAHFLGLCRLNSQSLLPHCFPWLLHPFMWACGNFGIPSVLAVGRQTSSPWPFPWPWCSRLDMMSHCAGPTLSTEGMFMLLARWELLWHHDFHFL